MSKIKKLSSRDCKRCDEDCDICQQGYMDEYAKLEAKNKKLKAKNRELKEKLKHADRYE